MLFDNVVSEYHHVGRVRDRASDGFRNRLTAQTVITIHEGHEFAGGRIQSGIASRGHPTVRLVNHVDTPIGFHRGIAEFRRPIRGPVIDQYDLKIRVGLRAQTVDAVVEILLCVPYRYDDAHQR